MEQQNMNATSEQAAEDQALAAAIRSRLEVEGRLASGANWFFWIAGLSVVNSVLFLTGSGWNFIVGLGITQVIDAIATESETFSNAAAFAIDLAVAGVFVLFGVFARQRRNWAFVVGMVIYTIDGLLFLLVQDWLSLGFHAFALYCIFKGLQAGNELSRMERAAAPLAVTRLSEDQSGGPPLV